MSSSKIRILTEKLFSLYTILGLHGTFRNVTLHINEKALYKEIDPFSTTRRYKRHQNKVKVKGFSRNSSYLAGFQFFFHILYTLTVSSVWGVADNTKEQRKQWGFYSVLLVMTRDPAEFGWHCWSNTAHPPPSSTTYVASWFHEKVQSVDQKTVLKIFFSLA